MDVLLAQKPASLLRDQFVGHGSSSHTTSQLDVTALFQGNFQCASPSRDRSFSPRLSVLHVISTDVVLVLCRAQASLSPQCPSQNDAPRTNSPPNKSANKQRKKAKSHSAQAPAQEAQKPDTPKNCGPSEAGGLSYSTHTPDVKSIPPPVELLNR